MSAVPLARAVETAACAAEVDGALRVLVNRPRERLTEQFRLRGSGEIEILPPLPLVAAGAAACGGELRVTGSDGGAPLVMSVDAEGRVRWSIPIPGPLPTRWPVPGCAPGLGIAWQTRSEALKVADAGPGGITHVRSIAVGGPPLDVSLGEAAWAAWPDGGGVRLASLRKEVSATHFLGAERPSAVAIGALGAGDAAVAWADRRGIFLARVSADGGIASPAAVDPGPAAGGRLAVVPGPEPVVWIRRTEMRGRDGEMEMDVDAGETERTSVSALVRAGHPPVLVDEPVFAVAWWGRRIAAVCAGAVRILEMEGA